MTLLSTPRQRQAGAGLSQPHNRPFRANISGINKVRNEYHVYMTDAQGKVVFDSANQAVGQTTPAGTTWLTLRAVWRS